jgi:phosphoribosylamine--glycine ligase
MAITLIVGGGGREAAIAMKLAEDSTVFAVMPHINPTIEHYVTKTHGQYLIGSCSNVAAIVAFALKHHIDLAFINSDETLAAGLVDALLAAGVKTVGPTKSGAQIEWDKGYAMQLMRQHYPEVTPGYWIVHDLTSLDAAIDNIRRLKIEIVVKPQGLTGGKGVKVMGAHLADLNAAAAYAKELLHDRPSESVVLVEKVVGVEFTLMLITDGVSVLRPPATYDYPYRFDGDTGPGTGGMGAFSNHSETLPFMSQQDYDKCIEVAHGILKVLKDEGRHYNGILNTGFFVTKTGLKFLEFNARFGDPECINIMTVLNGSLLVLLKDIEQKKLTTQSAGFTGDACVVKYLVTPEYALENGKQHQFTLDIAALKTMGIAVFFSASVRNDADNHTFTTVGNSRCVAVAAAGKTIGSACSLVEAGISQHVRGPLEWRRDVGSDAYIKSLCQ